MPFNSFEEKKYISTKENSLNRFKSLSADCLEGLSNSYTTLSKLSNRQIRKLAIKQINEENPYTFKDMTFEEKEELVAEREKDLLKKIKSSCTTSLALIFGISIGG
mgnify:CR=1 FL=1